METTSQNIDTLFLEERRYPPSPAFAAQANAQLDIYDRDFEEFWDTEGHERVGWFEPFTKLYEWEPPYVENAVAPNTFWFRNSHMPAKSCVSPP